MCGIVHRGCVFVRCCCRVTRAGPGRAWCFAEEFAAHTANVNCLKIGKRSAGVLVTGGDDKRVNMWAIGNPQAILSLTGHQTPVECVTFDAAEEVVAAGASGGAIKLWDLEEQRVLQTLVGHRSGCLGVEFHPFGQFVCSGSLDTQVKLWDIRRKGCIHTYKGHTGGVKHVKFSPDGRWVASGGEDGDVRIWDLTAGKQLAHFPLQGAAVTAVEYHPSEFLLATAGSDRSVRLWDLETLALADTLGPEATPAKQMVFAPDGDALLTANQDGLKAWAWEPARALDYVDMSWGNVAGLGLHGNRLLGCSIAANFVSLWAADLTRIGQARGEDGSAGEAGGARAVSASAAVGGGNAGGPVGMSMPSQSAYVPAPGSAPPQIPAAARLPPGQAAAAAALARAQGDRPPQPQSRGGSRGSGSRGTPSPETDGHEPAPKPGMVSIGIGAPGDSLLRGQGGAALVQAASAGAREAVVDLADRLAGLQGSGSRGASGLPPSELRRSPRSQAAPTGGQVVRGLSEAARRGSEGEPARKASSRGMVVRGVSQGSMSAGSPRAAVVSGEKSPPPITRTRTAPGLAPNASGDGRRQPQGLNFSEFVPSTAADVPIPAGPGAAPVPPGSAAAAVSEREVASEMLESHATVELILSSRLASLQVVRGFWARGDVKGAVSALRRGQDASVACDVLPVMMSSRQKLGLESLPDLCPVLRVMLESRQDRHRSTALDAVTGMVRSFGPTITGTLQAAEGRRAPGVDLSFEERMVRCEAARSGLEGLLGVLEVVEGDRECPTDLRKRAGDARIQVAAVI
ncbi:unnamed protein product [Pedinophyceae sp. YPF-701]|nr:unnamed protein product [Pedinophyceae sp. YPF-701]